MIFTMILKGYLGAVTLMKLITVGKMKGMSFVDHFFQRKFLKSSRREGYIQSFFDRLDTFSITNHATETLECSKTVLLLPF